MENKNFSRLKYSMADKKAEVYNSRTAQIETSQYYQCSVT